MQDNGTGGVVLDVLNDNSYWKFIPTENTDCYYIQNATTGKYIQGYDVKEQEVATGNAGVEYYVKADASGEHSGKYRMSCTANTPYDFSDGTLGLNWKGEIPGTVQSYTSVAGANPRSAWIVTVVTPPMVISTSKVYTISNGAGAYAGYYIKDKGETNLAAEESLDNACLWQFEDAGSDQFYVKNVKTGRYAQACSNTPEVAVTMGDTPVAYAVVNCSDKEGVANCFGLTSADHSNTAFTDGCVGWNLQNDNKVVQSYAAKAGTNHKSFWKFTEYEPQAITAGYASYGNTSEDVIILGAQAYKGTVNSSSILLSEVSDVPANNGVIIKGSLYAVASIASASSNMDDNDLLVSNGLIKGDGTSYYALSTLKGTEPIGFYPVGVGVTIPAGKAYIDTSAGVKGFTFIFDDDATGINAIDNGELTIDNAAIYNLAGQRLNKVQKGINIVNGKKILK